VGGAGGWTREHRGLAAKLVDVHAAPDDGRSELSVGRRSAVHDTEGNLCGEGDRQ
jgi:hypothetical protein